MMANEGPRIDPAAGARMRQYREKLGLGQKVVAERCEPPTTAQQIGRLESGQRKVTMEWAKRVAPALGVDPETILSGPRDIEMIPLVGYVGAGMKYYGNPEVGDWGQIELVEAPPGAREGVVAVRVRGDSMFPVYRDKDLLYFDRSREHSPEALFGQDCMVQVKGGSAYVKILRKGSRPGLYSLDSYNHETIADVEIAWAAPVAWVKRGG
jgi:transcriptional regulator with XRE-family HTH domain